MKKIWPILAVLLGLVAPASIRPFTAVSTAYAQGTVTMAGNVQQGINGQPLAGALLYIYVINTTATPQLAYQDINLTQALPWPVPADVAGRLPFFYLASGSVHLRMTDSGGGVVFDYPNVLVIGGAGGGGGGGGQVVDPDAIASTGDVKFRLSGELLSGWVVLNGQTIGNSLSGATGLASNRAQNLFVYLWTNCPNTHCPVTPGGRGANALADFNSGGAGGGKQLQLPDMRDSMPAGRDCMGNACLGGILLGNISSGGSDTADTPGAFGGAANQPIALTNLPALNLPVSVTIPPQWAHSHNTGNGSPWVHFGGSGFSLSSGGIGSSLDNTTTSVTNPTLNGSGSAALNGSNTALPIMSPFKLATYYIRL